MNKSVNHSHAVQLFSELRSRLVYSLMYLLVLFLILLYFANHLYHFLALPLLKFLPQGHLIATQVVSPFFVPCQLAFVSALLLTVPFMMYQLWHFIAPALYKHERRVIWPFVCISVVLFYLGFAFAYLVIFPLLFHFLTQVTPTGVLLTPDISAYFDFTLKLLIIFGCLFEIPMLMLLLVCLSVVTQQQLQQSRSYALVGAFVIGMLLAPPDVLSQTILAVPIYLLYEGGLLLSACALRIGKK